MAGKVPNLSPWGGPLRIKGAAHAYYSPFYQRWILRTWPKGQGQDSPMRALGRQTFSAVVKAIKSVCPEDREAVVEAAANTPYLDRDLLYKAATGTLLAFTDVNGRTWMSTRLAIQNIQPMLDSISSLPGSILFRNTNYWDALPIPVDGMVLMFDIGTGLPKWVEFADAVQLILDGLTTEHGAVAFRGATGWVVLDPGTPGQALKTQGTGNDVVWGDVAPPASLVDYGMNCMPGVGGSTTNSGGSCAGNVVTPHRQITLHAMCAQLTSANNASYRFGVAPWDATNKKILSAPVYTGAFGRVTGIANDTPCELFGTEPTLLADTAYMLFINKTTGLAADNITLGASGVQINQPALAFGTGAAWHLSSLAPTTSDVWTNISTTVFGVGALYRLG